MQEQANCVGQKGSSLVEERLMVRVVELWAERRTSLVLFSFVLVLAVKILLRAAFCVSIQLLLLLSILRPDAGDDGWKLSG